MILLKEFQRSFKGADIYGCHRPAGESGAGNAAPLVSSGQRLRVLLNILRAGHLITEN